jgi:hypothetical protein
LDGKFLFSISNLKFFKYYLSILKVNRAEQSKAKQSKAKQSKAKQSKAKQSKAALILIQNNLQQAWHLK